MADNLHQVLKSYEQEHIHLDENFLNQALVAATLNDNHECIGKLIKMGARNIDECIKLSKEGGLIKAKAMLFLLKAAQTGEKVLLHSSYTNLLLDLEHVLSDEVTKVVLNGEVSTLIPLELAQQSGQHSMRREILMLTNINKLKGHVNWSKLNLISLDVQLLERLHSWLREFRLSSNMLKSLPREFKILREVRMIKLLSQGVLKPPWRQYIRSGTNLVHFNYYNSSLQIQPVVRYDIVGTVHGHLLSDFKLTIIAWHLSLTESVKFITTH